jgi:hypothetical protein
MRFIVKTILLLVDVDYFSWLATFKAAITRVDI